MQTRLLLGAPGVYLAPEEPVLALTGERMDVAAFVGISPRGPARLPAFAAPWAVPPSGPLAPSLPLRSVPVPVESWDAYRRLYGGFEGPGLLPYAVAAFFEQGGRRAYVVRVVHDYGAGDPANDQGTAFGDVPGARPRGGGALRLRARNEGSWGNRLRVGLALRSRPLSFTAATATELTFSGDAPVPVGTLLRLRLADGSLELRYVSELITEWRIDSPLRQRRALLESPATAAPLQVEVVEADLVVRDTADDAVLREELHERLGLSARHPRWMAAVLYRDSVLVYPDPAWVGDDLEVDDPALRPPPDPRSPQFTCGRDRYAAITTDDFFDRDWVIGDERPRNGMHALVEVEEVSIVTVPDLYSPGPLVEREEVPDVLTLAGPAFSPCVDLAVELPPDPGDELCPDGLPASLDGSEQELAELRLDPEADFDRIVDLQAEVVDLAGTLQRWIVLLDVPPRLGQRRILDWRSRFGSPWAAGYHPWLRVSRPDDARDPLVSVPPSAFAAGIVARQELAFGVPHGPANVIAVGPVAAQDLVSPRRHDELHQSGVNVFVRERDGLRLTAGRTLSRDPLWRQMSVRRLVSMLGRALLRQMQWTVFEPNDARLRDELRVMLEDYLRGLFAAGAFRGRTPAEAFFVRCDDELNPPHVVDLGRLVCLVGVAPAEPLEFIALKLSREGDGTLLMEA